jgi:manganese-dependent ADP-ribose/CDP-alcohol diphosphatase
LNDIKEIIHGIPFPFKFCYGNHDYYAFNRKELLHNFVPGNNTPLIQDDNMNNVIEKLPSSTTIGGVCTPEKLYYDFSPYPGFRCLVLDSYDVSLIGILLY